MAIQVIMNTSRSSMHPDEAYKRRNSFVDRRAPRQSLLLTRPQQTASYLSTSSSHTKVRSRSHVIADALLFRSFRYFSLVWTSSSSKGDIPNLSSQTSRSNRTRWILRSRVMEFQRNELLHSRSRPLHWHHHASILSSSTSPQILLSATVSLRIPKSQETTRLITIIVVLCPSRVSAWRLGPMLSNGAETHVFFCVTSKEQ